MTVSRILGCERPENIRPKTDFFETPSEVIRALIKAQDTVMPRKIWEPFFGNGAIAVWLMNGRGVYCTDLNPHKLNSPIMPDALRVDFLLERKLPNPDIQGIVSNPPFTLARQIIEHALDVLNIEYMALLLKADFFNSENSHKLFIKFPPQHIYALSWRPDFRNQGSPTMNCSWYIWNKKSEGFPTTFSILGKP